jgi:hypothetical protein
MSNEIFFTDSVKDVIGNDPVLDQFDTYYEASFYGTMQDDYITGTIISEIISDFSTSSEKKERKFITGSRGKILSKFYAESTPALSSVYGSADVTRNPLLSYRLVPWSERTSTTSYRISQAVDPNERYYDSCLPNIAECFALNGSRVWENFDSNSEARNHTVLSPYGSAVTGSVGYMIFNSIPQDRSAEGYESDPVVNNDWTWSFPFEPKYRNKNRLIGFDKSLGLKSSLNARFPIYDKKERELKGYYYEQGNSADADTSAVDLSEASVKNILDFIPVFPGYLEGFQNSFRTKTTITGGLGDGRVRTSWYKDNSLERNYGHSLLVLGEVNLSKQSDRNFLSSFVNADSGTMLLTQSAGTDDKIKMLFGFGDLNTITYGKREFDSSKATLEYSLDLESTSDGTYAHQLSSYSANGLSVNWNFDPNNVSNAGTVSFKHRWYVANKNLASPITYQNESYNVVSGSTSASGIAWKVSDGGNKILVSNTSNSLYGGTMLNNGLSVSPLIVDITSSYPWRFSYDRAVAVGEESGDFENYLAGYPGQPSDVLEKTSGPLSFYNFDDNMFDRVVGVPGLPPSPTVSNIFVTMSKYDSIDEIQDRGQYLLDPGEYRLVFKFNYSLVETTNPLVAAINNFKIFTYKEDAFPVTGNSRIGGNNYPKFKGYRLDERLNPVLSGSSLMTSDYLVSGSADASRSVIFGISPEIRGWKYGLYNGLPSNSKAIFRRDRYGQVRDMLEQRPYTKFVNVNTSALDDDAMTNNNFDIQTESKLNILKQVTSTGPSAAEVNFVRYRYKKDDRGIGYIYSEKVDPRLTISQNLSPEVTSSLPYFDGEAKLRQEEDLLLITDATLTSLQFGPNGLTVT